MRSSQDGTLPGAVAKVAAKTVAKKTAPKAARVRKPKVAENFVDVDEVDAIEAEEEL
jgi:hypothetical protein